MNRSFRMTAWGGRTPDKYETIPFDDEDQLAGAHRGQVFVMFAFFAIALLGVLGLATDVGYAMSARRAAQGAADAGALAGARVVARYASGTTTAQSEVSTIVTSNEFGPLTPTLQACDYIGNNWSVLTSCSTTVPSSAVGTRVRTRIAFSTFFLRVIPGAPSNLTAAGFANARVETAVPSDLAAPFIICGADSWAVKDTNGATIDKNIPILTSDDEISSAAVGVTFRVHDNKLDKNHDSDCLSKAARFKGLADQEANVGKTVPSWFDYDTGTKAGPTRSKVGGTQGCGANATSPYSCVMILPIATNDPKETGNSKQLYVVGYAAFLITQADSNSHNAKLLDNYILTSGGGTATWCRDCGGMVVIRLIW